MLICKVVKPLVSTNRIPGFEHKHLQVVLDGSSIKLQLMLLVVSQEIGLFVLEVLLLGKRGSKSYPSDLTIVGIIDHWDPDKS